MKSKPFVLATLFAILSLALGAFAPAESALAAGGGEKEYLGLNLEIDCGRFHSSLGVPKEANPIKARCDNSSGSLDVWWPSGYGKMKDCTLSTNRMTETCTGSKGEYWIVKVIKGGPIDP